MRRAVRGRCGGDTRVRTHQVQVQHALRATLIEDLSHLISRAPKSAPGSFRHRTRDGTHPVEQRVHVKGQIKGLEGDGSRIGLDRAVHVVLWPARRDLARGAQSGWQPAPSSMWHASPRPHRHSQRRLHSSAARSHTLHSATWNRAAERTAVRAQHLQHAEGGGVCVVHAAAVNLDARIQRAAGLLEVGAPRAARGTQGEAACGMCNNSRARANPEEDSMTSSRRSISGRDHEFFWLIFCTRCSRGTGGVRSSKRSVRATGSRHARSRRTA